MNMKKMLLDICVEYHITGSEISRRFNIPLRTVQDWKSGKRKPPEYVLNMLEELLRLEREG